MALYMPWGEQVAFKTPAERQQLSAELSAFIQPGKPSGQKVPLASVADMVRQAQERWGRDNVGRVTAVHPGDAAARVSVARGEAGRVSMSPQYMEFEGTTGKLLTVRDKVGAAAETRGVLYALHLGRFSDTEMRWLYFLVSFMGTAMVGTGLVMWTVKRRQKLPDPDRPYFGFRLVERLNIASIAGLSIAMTAFLWANRLLPHPLEGRADWEIHAFFIVWGLTLLHALVRPARSAWVEQLWAASALLFLLPVLNALTTQRPLWHSLVEGRLGLRRYRYDVLGARVAPCGSGDTHGPAGSDFSVQCASQSGRLRSPSPPARERDESSAGLRALPGRLYCVGVCHASPAARYHRQVAAVGHDLRPSRCRRLRPAAGARLSCRREGLEHWPRDVQRSYQYMLPGSCFVRLSDKRGSCARPSLRCSQHLDRAP